MQKTITQQEYQTGLTRLESLLKIVGNDTDPSSKAFQELEELSELIAAYEESNHPFKPSNLQEMIELRRCKRKLS